MRKALLYFALILALQGIAIIAALPNWIPEWENVPIIISIVAHLGAVFFSYKLVRLFWAKMKIKLEPALRGITIAVLSILLLGWLSLTGVFTAIMAQGGLFAPLYVTQHEFPDHHTTLYIYDGSFLEPQTDIFVRRGIWPWMQLVTRIPEARLWKAEPEREGDWVILVHFKYNLKTGEANI